jgi:hypothetical protein
MSLAEDKVRELLEIGRFTAPKLTGAKLGGPQGGERHRAYVDELGRRGWLFSSFMERVSAAVIGHSCKKLCVCEQDLDDSEPFCSQREFKSNCTGRPDAYLIDVPSKIVVVAEVDITHETTGEKYRELAWALDDEGWTFWGLLISYGGHIEFACTDTDLICGTFEEQHHATIVEKLGLGPSVVDLRKRFEKTL